MHSSLSKIAKALLKLADVCPQCGSALAKNGPLSTECPNPNCTNYSVRQDQQVRTTTEISPPAAVGTLEYNRTSIPNIVELPVSGRMWSLQEIGLPSPIIHELNSVLGDKAYVVQIPLPFKWSMIPAQYCSNASSSLIRISLNNIDVFVTNSDENTNTFYMKDVGILARFLEGLNILFGKPQYNSSDQLQQLSKPTNTEYNDLARHPIPAPLADKLA